LARSDWPSTTSLPGVFMPGAPQPIRANQSASRRLFPKMRISKSPNKKNPPICIF
jgi:hypothetical protein